MPLLKEEMYTVDDIYALPEGERAELIDGKIYNMAPPNTRHQEISIEVSSTIRDYIRSNNGKCKVFAAPFAELLQFINSDQKKIMDTIHLMMMFWLESIMDFQLRSVIYYKRRVI